MSVNQNTEDLILTTGGQITAGDFVKNYGGTAKRCFISEATHAATHGATGGELVRCVTLEKGDLISSNIVISWPDENLKTRAKMSKCFIDSVVKRAA